MRNEKQGRDRPRLAPLIFVGCGIWLIGLGLYFIFLRPSLLPEDLQYIGASQGQIQSAVPRLNLWLEHIFTVMGGFMTGSGVLTILVAMNSPAVRKKRTLVPLAVAGLLTVGTMSVTNFQIDSDFKWLLLIPSVLWAIGLMFATAVSRTD